MAATLNSIVLAILVTLDAPSVSRAGFGTLLIAGPNFAPESGAVIGFFTSAAAALVGTGLTDSSPEYKAAVAAFSQTGKPRRIAIGRLRARVAQVTTFAIGTQADGTWTVTVDGTAYTFAATGSATASAIAAGLRSALGSVPGVTVSGSAANVVLTANVAGVGFTATITAPAGGAATTTATTANRSVANELDAIAASNSDWFGLCITSRVEEDIWQASAWAESRSRVFLAQTSDAATLTTSTSDIGSRLKAAARRFTLWAYHHANGECLDAAWAAKVLSYSLETQSPTWAFHTLSGITVSPMDETQLDNVLGKNGNVYLTLKLRPSTWEGKVANGKYIDEIIIAEWFKARVEEDIAQMFLDTAERGEKVPFTDEGFARFEAIQERRYQLGVTAKHFSPGQNVGTYPRRADLPDDQVASRLYTWSASIQLAGAIHRTGSTINLTASSVVPE